MRPTRRTLSLALTVGFSALLVLLWGVPGSAQTRFAVEVSAGQNLGLTSYVDNVVVVQGDLPLLADELPGSGAVFDLRFVLSEWAIGGAVHIFDRQTIRLHHRGTETLPPNRIRPDGSVDDSGIDYVEIDPIRSPNPAARPGDLLIIDIGAAYRFYVLEGTFGVWFPAAASFVATKILDVGRPTILGVQVGTGFGVSYDIAPPIALFLTGDIRGVMTPAYRPLSDASRTSYTAGEPTEAAVFSSMAYGAAMFGLEFTVR